MGSRSTKPGHIPSEASTTNSSFLVRSRTVTSGSAKKREKAKDRQKIGRSRHRDGHNEREHINACQRAEQKRCKQTNTCHSETQKARDVCTQTEANPQTGKQPEQIRRNPPLTSGVWRVPASLLIARPQLGTQLLQGRRKKEHQMICERSINKASRRQAEFRSRKHPFLSTLQSPFKPMPPLSPKSIKESIIFPHLPGKVFPSTLSSCTRHRQTLL